MGKNLAPRRHEIAGVLRMGRTIFVGFARNFPVPPCGGFPLGNLSREMARQPGIDGTLLDKALLDKALCYFAPSAARLRNCRFIVLT